VGSDEELESLIKNSGGDRCSIVFFYLPWCPSCQKMNPFVEQIAAKNPNAMFLKVDAEKCIIAAKKHRITKVPIFVLYNNRTRVDRVEGASPIELESKIKRIIVDLAYKKVSSGGGGSGGYTPLVQGTTPKMSDISDYLDRRNCRVVNDLVPTPLNEFLTGNKLISGRGMGRLLLVYAFTEKMVIQSFKVKAPVHSGPRILRFFTNVGPGVDIDDVYHMSASQEVMLSESDLSGDHLIDLRQGGFVGITSLQIFIPENMTNSRRIEIDHLILNGAPLTMTPYFGQNSGEASSHATRAGTASAGGPTYYQHPSPFR